VHCHARSCLLYPRGPRSGLGSIVPVHLRLIGLMRPTLRHIPFSPHGGLYGMSSLCWCAEATLEWLHAFAVCSFSACRPLRLRGVRRLHSPSSFADDTGLHPFPTGSALPSTPPSASSGRWISELYQFISLRLVEWLACLGGSDRHFPGRPRLLLLGFHRVGHPSRCQV
jgi:hypothetical protein